jgi:hypothetical protein
MAEFIENENPAMEEFVEELPPQPTVNRQRNEAIDKGALVSSKGIDPEGTVRGINQLTDYVPKSDEELKEEYLTSFLSDVQGRR